MCKLLVSLRSKVDSVAYTTCIQFLCTFNIDPHCLGESTVLDQQITTCPKYRHPNRHSVMLSTCPQISLAQCTIDEYYELWPIPVLQNQFLFMHSPIQLQYSVSRYRTKNSIKVVLVHLQCHIPQPIFSGVHNSYPKMYTYYLKLFLTDTVGTERPFLGTGVHTCNLQLSRYCISKLLGKY